MNADEGMEVVCQEFRLVYRPKLIAACGNDCEMCPRHMPQREEALKHTAELWKKIGYRDRVVTPEEIQCFGCKRENPCRYEIVKCVQSHRIEHCGRCEAYPCEKIQSAFQRTAEYETACQNACTPEEYHRLYKAFFEKQLNLEKNR